VYLNVKVARNINDNVKTSVKLKRGLGAGSLGLTPVILAPQEAEIRRIAVQDLPRQIVHETLF
jgi:hypothetical protein